MSLPTVHHETRASRRAHGARWRRGAVLPAMLPAAALALGLSACASPTAESPAQGAPSPTTSTTAGFAPLTVDNCGSEVVFDAPPERVVTIKSTATETMLALGLEDRLVGTAFSDGPLPEGLADAAAAVPVLSEKVPGQEALLASEPDLVYAGWESNFSAEGAGERPTLAALGIASYVSPAACLGEGYQPDPLTFDVVFDGIREVGAIFGVQERAEDLVAEQEATLAGVDAPTGTTTALWFSSGSDTPYVGAGIGAPQMIMDAAGLTNIFADVHESWTSVGWEQVVAADPDVIVLVDSAWGSTEKKIGVLESNPATSQLTAVREKRYLVVPFPASEAGVRNADAVADLVAQLAALPAVG